MTALAVALLTGLCVLIALPAPVVIQRSVRRPHGAGFLLPAVLLVAPPVLGGLLAGLHGAIWGLVVAVAGLTATRRVAGMLRVRRRERARAEVAHATQMVAGMLRVGAVPGVALASAARDCTALERPAATLAIGGDVARALHDAARPAGHDGLAALGRAWELSERTGAPVAALAAQVGDQLRRDRETEQVVQAELAGPRATAKLLAGLPLVGMLMGRMSGGDPVVFLLHTTPGLLCLAGGVVLACAGLEWSELMAQRATEV